jgi:cation diffusion facilitator family transporter
VRGNPPVEHGATFGLSANAAKCPPMSSSREGSEESVVPAPSMRPGRPAEVPNRVRVQAAVVSVVVGTIVLGFKYLAYQLTGSTAILSDALESIINVVAALFALGGLIVAGWPADRTHPYGHGKVEYFTAAFEGGMIALAAVLIIKESGEALLFGHQVRQLDFGLLITVGTGAMNALLGWYLLQVGKRYRSVSLVADGTHVLSDFRTSLATAIGLALVRVTGRAWFDPAVAALIGLSLVWTGARLVRHAAGGLLDEEDTGLLGRVVEAINTNLVPGVIRFHSLRAIRAGRYTHVAGHLVVPEFWTVEEANDFATAFEHRVSRSLGVEGEIGFRVAPCHRQFCASCEVAPCPIRVQPFVSRSWIILDDAVRPSPVG